MNRFFLLFRRKDKYFTVEAVNPKFKVNTNQANVIATNFAQTALNNIDF